MPTSRRPRSRQAELLPRSKRSIIKLINERVVKWAVEEKLADPTVVVADMTAQEAKALFGKAPKAYAYDRAGWSEANVAELKHLGVRAVGLAPRGKATWQVAGKVKDKLVSERAQVEGCIGSVKSR